MENIESIINKPAGSLIKTTLVDFPGLVASTIFLEGCNLRCPYCYNKSLVQPDKQFSNNAKDRDYICSTAGEVINHLEKRKNVLGGFVISGGEPLLNSATPFLIKKAKELGLKVKLDTNGTLPGLLKNLVENSETRPDYIAMDLKTTPERYIEMNPMKVDYSKKLLESIKIISKFPKENREWRTVLVPTLAGKEEIQKISELLPEDAQWFFAHFRNENCINPHFNEISPYLDSEEEELLEIARKRIPGAAIR